MLVAAEANLQIEQCDTMENFYTTLQMKYRVSRIWVLSSQKPYFRARDQDLNVDTTVCQPVSSDVLMGGDVRCQACRWFNMHMEPFSEDPGHLDEGIPVQNCFMGSHMDEKDAHAWLRRDSLVHDEKYAALCVPPQNVMGTTALTPQSMNDMAASASGVAPTNLV